MRQAAGCWRIPQPCTSDTGTQHSSLRLYHGVIIPASACFFKGGFAGGVESLCVALILIKAVLRLKTRRRLYVSGEVRRWAGGGRSRPSGAALEFIKLRRNGV